ncbi:melanoma cell adhesion molecule b isoform 2-T2 [Anableps anableps]
MGVWNAASLLGLLALLHTWGARAYVEVNMEDKVEAVLGDPAQIACIFTSGEGTGGSGGMVIKWYYVKSSGNSQLIYDQDTLQKTVQKNTPYTDRITVNNTGTTGQVVLTISDVKLSDEVDFICHVQIIGEGTGEGRTKLRVFKAPDYPTIEGMENGISVNDEAKKIASCKVKNGYPKPEVTWYKDNTPLRTTPDVLNFEYRTTTGSSGLYSVESDLIMKVKKEDKDAVFYCEIRFFVPGAEKMFETNRINITVYYPPTAAKMWVESPKNKIKEDDTVELHCASNGNNPAQEFTIKTPNRSPSSAKIMVMKNVSRLDSGVYECIVLETENFGEFSANTTVFVNYLDDAIIEPKGTVLMEQNKELKASCNALASLNTKTTWLKNGKEVAKGHHLSLEDLTYDSAGTYVCVVTVPEIPEMQTSASLQVHVQGPPKILEKYFNEKETTEKELELTCHVRGHPTPQITWTTSEGKVISSASQTKTEVGAKSVVKVVVTSNMTIFCNSSNDFGTDSVMYNIKIIKAETSKPQEKVQTGSNGVIIAVIIICILLLAILGSVLYFLYKKGKICNRSGKKDFTKEKSGKDKIVVEMKSDNTEEAILLGVNGEKQLPSDQ